MMSLSDRELSLIMDAARPVPLRDREAFLEAVAAELRGYPPERVGEGLVYQVTRRVQREMTRPRWRQARCCRLHGDL